MSILAAGTCLPTQRSYTPSYVHITKCNLCEVECFPFPHSWSVLCSSCWYKETEKAVEKVERLLRVSDGGRAA